MAKKSPVTTKPKAPIADSIPVASNPAVASPAIPAVPVVQPAVSTTQTRKAEPRKLEIVKNDARKNIVPWTMKSASVPMNLQNAEVS